MNQPLFDIIDHKKKLCLFLFLIFCGQTIVSCRKENRESEKNRFKITVDLISYQEKTIQVFYKLKTDDRYYEKLSLKKIAKTATTSQRLIFEFPHGIKPKNIRLDLGENENDSIRLENVSFQYKNRVIKGDNGLYKSWFIFNQNVIKGKDSLTYHLKRIDNFFDPQLNGNQILNSKLAKLFPPDINEH